MIENEFYSDLRELIGNPNTNAVTNRKLRPYLVYSLEYLAEELEYNVVTSDIALVADQLEYTLPSDLTHIVWVEWNTNRLEPFTTFGWENDGTDWRDATSNSPTGYAVQGRHLILNPPPSSTAIATSGVVTVRYIGASAGMNAGGTPGLSVLDQRLVVYQAALDYCVANPSDENAARAQGYQMRLTGMWETAKARHRHPIEDQSEGWHIKARRVGGAR